ncbi:MAG: nucleotidyltransferase, partial [Firmicutes bacterium]|nr:nucleotidyltransferase [Bacillota bacterium]
MRKKPVLVVMAAGMGSRYGGLKQIDPIGPAGEIIIDYSLYDAKAAGFETAIFIIKHSIEKDFKAIIERGAAKHMKVLYAYQDINDIPEGFEVPEGREKPWGTGHAILAARDLIDAPFAVINADDYYGREVFR